MYLDYDRIVSGFGEVYLNGGLDKVLLDGKFCMIDNFSVEDERRCSGNVSNIHFPVLVSMSFCVFCKRGHMDVRAQQKEYSIQTNEVLVLFAGQILEATSVSEDCQLLFIAVDSEFILSQFRNRYGNVLRHWILRSTEPTVVKLSEEDARNYVQICSGIKHFIRNVGSDYADGILYGFTTIFGNLISNWYTINNSPSTEYEKTGSHAEKVLLNFQNDMHNYYSQQRTVNYYAARQNLSTRQFARLIDQACGRKPSELINEYIILEAKSLLRSGMFNVHQVCERLGFKSDSCFNRFFRNETGISPGQFARQSLM